jgi:hypothetical protein
MQAGAKRRHEGRGRAKIVGLESQGPGSREGGKLDESSQAINNNDKD